jgi:hypothetical protein
MHARVSGACTREVASRRSAGVYAHWLDFDHPQRPTPPPPRRRRMLPWAVDTHRRTTAHAPASVGHARQHLAFAPLDVSRQPGGGAMVLSAGGLEGGRGCGRKPFPPTRRRCGCRVAWGCAAGGVAVKACTTKRPSLCMCAPVRTCAHVGGRRRFGVCGGGAWGDGTPTTCLGCFVG